MCRKQHKIMAQKRLEKGQLRKKISEDINARKTVMLTHLTNNLGIEKNAPGPRESHRAKFLHWAKNLALKHDLSLISRTHTR